MTNFLLLFFMWILCLLPTPGKAEIIPSEVDSDLIIHNSDQGWWKALGERMWENQSDGAGQTKVFLSRREWQSTVFSNYLKFLRQTAISINLEELRLQRLEAQGNVNGDQVIHSVCPASVYNQRNSYLPSALEGSESSFTQAYCGLECIPPGGHYATYAPSSQTCFEEAAQIYQSFHKCDSEISLWEQAGFYSDSSAHLGSPEIDLSRANVQLDGFLPGSSSEANPFTAIDLEQAFAVQNSKCSRAQSVLAYSTFDTSNPVVSMPAMRNPEEYSSYDPTIGLETTSALVAVKNLDECMIDQAGVVSSRLDRLKNHYWSIVSISFNESFAGYPFDEIMKADALEMTDRYFERIFNAYDSGNAMQACMEGADLRDFTKTSIETFVNTITFADKIGSEGNDVKELMARVDSVDQSKLTEAQLIALEDILSRYSDDLSKVSSTSAMSGEIFGVVASVLIPGSASRVMNYIRGLGVASAEGRVLVLLEKVSGILNRPFLPGGQTGTVSVALGRIEKISPWGLTPTHRLTKNKLDYEDLYNQLSKDGAVKESIKYVAYKGEKYIVDGHHRAYVSKKLRFSEVPVEEVQLPYNGYKTIADLFYK